MLEIGLLEEATRESTDYGVNEENPQSPDQTSPYYYKDSFAELAKLLIQANEAG